MRSTNCPFFAVSVIALIALAACARRDPFPPPPGTKAAPVEDQLHGTTIVDPYRWLEDQEAAETRAWIAEQNAYTDRLLGEQPGREELAARLGRLLKVDSVGIPIERGGKYFYRKRLADQDQHALYVREGLTGAERVLVDPLAIAADASRSIEFLDVCREGALVAYSVRESGQDEVEIRFRDVATGADLPDTLPKSKYFGLSLAPDGKTYFYTEFLAEGPRVFQRRLGESNAQRIFGEGYGPERIAYAGVSEDGEWLVIHVLVGSSGKRTEVWLRPVTASTAPVAVTTTIEATFSADVAKGVLYLQTTLDAPNGRILVADPESPSPETWRELVPERKDAVLESMSLAAGRIFANYLENVQSKLVVFDTTGAETGTLAFDTIGTVGGISGRWDSNETFFQFTSFHVPTQIHRYDAETKDRSIWFQPNVPIDPSSMEVEQVRYASKDGTSIPMFIVHKKGMERSGSAPTLLYGYGGFRVTQTPAFSAIAAAFVDMGGVYAVANLRGGGEFGEAWHEAGMLERKQNTFDDFIAAAEWLVANRYTRPEKLAIYGGSNGGLLVGASMTQRPDLFQAVVCSYPLLDMLRYHHFLVAKFWVPEYGSADDPTFFEIIRAYSPYHNVREKTDYPATLFVTGDGDTRVAPLHARKMAALLQAQSALRRPVMIRYHESQGHAGGTPVSQVIEDGVDLLTFLRWQLGV